MPMPPALLELQRAFAAALDAADDGSLHTWIATRGIAPEARLRIYRNTRFATHVETLLSVFPAVTRWIGEACFDGLATRFAARHGSHSGNLQEFGRVFPDFLRTQPEVAAWPWLAELAQLEWLRQECALAEARPCARTDVLLAAVASSDDPPLRVQPHVRVLSSTMAVLDRWYTAMCADFVLPSPSGPQSVLLWRENDEVRMCAITPPLAGFVQTLVDGASFSAACATACAGDAAPDPATLLLPLFERALIAPTRDAIPATEDFA